MQCDSSQKKGLGTIRLASVQEYEVNDMQKRPILILTT